MAKKAKAVEAVPAALAKAVAKHAKKIESKSCYGIPHFTLDTKLKPALVELGDMSLFEANKIDRATLGEWLPFATLKDKQFLLISIQPPYAVGMYEKDDGTVYAGWPSLDDFVAKLIDHKDKTPFHKLDKKLEQVGKLVEDDQYGDALGILEPIMTQLPKLSPGSASFYEDDLGRAYNLYGLSLKGVKKLDAARAAFETAVVAGDNYAILNLLDMLEDAHQSRELIELALKMREQHYFDSYCRIWIARYLAVAYAVSGDLAKAEAELRKSVDDYAVSDADKLKGARESIEKYIAEGHPNAAKLKPFLDWYKPKSYEVSPAQAKANKKLWQSFPEGMREALMEEINKEDQEPTDEDIARCLDVDSVHLDEDVGTFDKLDVFLNFPRVERLAFYGDPEDLEPLRALPKLERVTVNNTIYKNFEFPSRADRDLLAAAENGNKKGMEKALAAGANIDARDDFGANCLFRAAGKHDMALTTWLISKGADPWAGNHSEMTTFSMYGDEDKAKLEAAAKKAGIRHPREDPYREFSFMRERGGATFDTEIELELEDGEPLAGKWPAKAVFAMKPPKKDNKLYDLHNVKYRGLVASERLAELLRVPGVELHPVQIVDHAGKVRPDKYFFVNPLMIDCLDLAKCHPQWNHIDPESMSGVGAHVIDPAKTGGAQCFRVDRDNSHPCFITKQLAEKLEAGGFTGLGISYAKR